MSELASNPMNFNESQHGSILLERLRQQRESGRFCDVTLYVGDRTFRAHRSVLASCSAYFASVFQTRRAVRERLTVTCRDPEAFSALVNYMYTGSVALDRVNVGEILRLANHFIVPRLKGHCGEYLDRHLALTNCLSALELAERCALPALVKTASAFVQLHLAKVVHGEEILALPALKLHAFLANKSWQLPPAQALSLSARWVSRDVAGRQREMRRLLSSVDWAVLGQVAACEHVDREPLYSASEACLLAALRALADHGLLYPKYQPVYQALQDKMAATGFPADSYLGATTSALSEEEFQLKPEATEKCEPLRESRVFRRRKRKLALTRPGARLAALRAALTLRQRRRAAEGAANDSAGAQGGSSKCHLCGHLASDPSALELHLASAHLRETTYKCGVCGFLCACVDEHTQHMGSHFPGPPHRCDQCDSSWPRLGALLSHRAAHLSERVHRCSECSFRCRSRAALAAHARCHATDKSHKCDVCSRAFPSRSLLDQHALTHGANGANGTNGTSLQCPTCGFTTRHAAHLAAHRRMHTGEVHRCAYPGCKFSSPKKAQLAAHARSHAGARPHSCAVCGRGFLEKSHLVRHERIHLQEKPFKCSECEYASSRRDKLKEHFTRHHGEHASAKVPYKARPLRSKHKPCAETTSHFANPLPPPHQSSELDLLPPHPSLPPPSPYPSFPDHLDYPHHQLRPAKQDAPLFSVSANRNAAVAAMMLDPRFHHPNNASAYHSMVAPAQGANQNAGLQHQDYPCMPLF